MQSGDVGSASAGVAAVVMVAERIGVQEPRIRCAPEYATSRGREAIELAESAGLILDPWQELVLVDALGCRPDGKWAAFEVGVNVPRQNGKGGILEARELAALFAFGERLVIHSAHEFATSMEAFLRMEQLLESSEELSRQVKSVSRSHGSEGFKLLSGQRLNYRTRTKGGGRGFSGDLLVLDEAMILALAAIGALVPTLSARPNPQVWYAGSSVDQLVHEHGLVFARVRSRGLRGDGESLVYVEHSAGDDTTTASNVAAELLVDPAAWAQANPGLGIRITEEHVANELRSMDARTFAVERLGIGDWPDIDDADGAVISTAAWAALADEASTVDDPVCFAFDVKPDRSSASIGVAGERDDGLVHVELVDRRHGTGWVVPRLVELRDRHDAVAFVCDERGPAASLLHELEEAGVKVVTVNGQEYAQACGLLFDLVEQERLRHLGTQELSAAVRGARKRPLGDAWAWSRKNSSVDISPLVAVTLAAWGSKTAAGPAEPWAETW